MPQDRVLWSAPHGPPACATCALHDAAQNQIWLKMIQPSTCDCGCSPLPPSSRHHQAPPHPAARPTLAVEGRDHRCLARLEIPEPGLTVTDLTPAGKKIFEEQLPNSEPKLRAVFDKTATSGTVLVIVDQPASIGALPLTVTRDAGCKVA